MDIEILDEQIEYLNEMGFGGFHMHSRTGMAVPYLGEEFMNLVKFCTNKAKSKNMLAYLYDEDRWPSGTAGGFVTRNPRYRARYIELHIMLTKMLSVMNFPKRFRQFLPMSLSLPLNSLSAVQTAWTAQFSLGQCLLGKVFQRIITMIF